MLDFCPADFGRLCRLMSDWRRRDMTGTARVLVESKGHGRGEGPLLVCRFGSGRFRGRALSYWGRLRWLVHRYVSRSRDLRSLSEALTHRHVTLGQRRDGRDRNLADFFVRPILYTSAVRGSAGHLAAPTCSTSFQRDSSGGRRSSRGCMRVPGVGRTDSAR